MKRTLYLKCVLMAAAFIFALSTAATAQMALDLDPAPGDQGVREAQANPGDMKTIELAAVKGAKGIIGFEVELKLDSKQVIFKSFQATGLMTGAMAMPPQRTAEGVKISVAIMGGSTSPADAGTLGQILVEFTRDLGPETAIELVKGSFGSVAGTQAFPLQGGVKFTSGKAPKAVPPSPPPPSAPPPPALPVVEPPGLSGQRVEDPNEPNIPDGKDFKALAVNVQGDVVRVQINTYADWAFRPFQSLYFKGGEKGQLHVMLMGDQFAINGETPGKRGMFTVKLFQGKGELKGSEYVLKFPWIVAFGNSPEVEAWVFSQDGRDRIPDGRATLKVQRGSAMAGAPPPPTGAPTGLPAPVGTPGVAPAGPPATPKQLIKALPPGLRGPFQQTLAAEKQSIGGKLMALRSAKQALMSTKRYLPKAGEEEKAAIAEALMFFHRGEEAPPAVGPAGPSGSMEAMIGQMAEEIDGEIKRLLAEVKLLNQ